MNRRNFLTGMVTTAAGLILPYEPKRIYSFPSRNLRQFAKHISFALPPTLYSYARFDVRVTHLFAQKMKAEFEANFPAVKEYTDGPHAAAARHPRSPGRV